MATRVRSEYEVGLKDDVSAKLRGIQTGFDKFKVSVAATAGVVAVGAVAIGKLVTNAVDLGDQLAKTAQRTGLTVEQLSALKVGADLSDVAFETLARSAQFLNRQMAEALRGSAEGERGFNALGISVTTADGRLRDTYEVLSDVAEALSKLPDGATKTALAMQVLGRGGAQLIPLLNGGAEGLRAFTREAERLGVVVSTDAAKQAEVFNDNLTRLRTVATGVGVALARDLVPVVNDVAEAFKKGYEQGGLFDATLDALRKSAELAFGDPLQNQIRGTENQIEGLQKKLDRLRGDSFGQKFQNFVSGDLVAEEVKKTEAELTRLEARLKALREVADVKPAAAAESGDDAAKRAAERAAAQALADEENAKKREAAAVRLAKSQESYLANLRKQLALEGESTELARVRADIQEGAAKQFSEAAQTEATALAEQLDLLRDTADVHEYLLSVEKDRRAEAEQAKVALSQERQATIEALRTPLEAYNDEIERLNSLSLDDTTLRRGIVAAKKELEEAEKAANKTSDAARDLGLTFTSAFEDAIVEGKNLSEVLNGLIKDIARIAIRKTLTEPLGNAISGAFSGGGSGGGVVSFVKSLFGNDRGGLYRVGGSSSEHPVAFTARAGEVVAVGTGVEQGGGLSVVVNNYSGERVRTRERRGAGGRRELEVAVGELTAGNVGAGRFAPMGILPPLAAR